MYNKFRTLLCLCAALLLLVYLAGCGRKQVPVGAAYELYFLNREETKISTETKYLEEDLSQEEQIGKLLEEMQVPPENVALKASVGNVFQVLSWQVEEEQLNLDMDSKYRDLSPTTEILVRAALVRTLTQVEGINHVLVTVDGLPLTDTTGNAVSAMTADNFVDNVGAEMNAPEKVTLHLYFASEDGTRLVETNRTVVYNSNISMEKLVLENLILGPDVENAFPVLNPATKVLNATVKDGTCYVNLDEIFLTQTYDVSAEVTVFSLVNSLVELPNINRVQIAVDGRSDIIYRETFNLANLYERNLDLSRSEEAKE